MLKETGDVTFIKSITFVQIHLTIEMNIIIERHIESLLHKPYSCFSN